MTRRLAGIAMAATLLEPLGCAPTARGVGARTSTVVPDDDPIAIADRIALDHIDRHPAARLPWSWSAAVFTFGLARLAVVSPRRAEWIAYLREYYVDRRRPPEIRRPDDCAPALGAAVLVRELNQPDAAVALQPVTQYVRTAPRNRLGALDHLDPRTPLGRLYPASIWVDSMMMYGLAAALAAQALDDPQLRTFASTQPQIFAAQLQDPQAGMFRHAALHRRGRLRPSAPTFWLRGNGWAAASMVEWVAMMSPDDPHRAAIIDRLLPLLLALRRHRGADGMWTTVIDDPRTYPETSGTALVAFALAKAARLGLVDARSREQARQTLHTLVARLRVRGDRLSLPGISGPTIPSRRLGYAVVPRAADLSYGVGAVLLLAAELAQPEPVALLR